MNAIKLIERLKELNALLEDVTELGALAATGKPLVLSVSPLPQLNPQPYRPSVFDFGMSWGADFSRPEEPEGVHIELRDGLLIRVIDTIYKNIRHEQDCIIAQLRKQGVSL